MLRLSGPLSVAQVCRYHAEEFRNARDNYFTTAHEICGQWHGQLARQWGLTGDVQEEQVHRLADGRHPITDQPLVGHKRPYEYTNVRGKRVATMAHRAGWEAVFSAPKSVSLTALVGADARVVEAHRASVRVALDETERYAQTRSRVGNTRSVETTGKWIVACFEHDSARPVDGYAAPHLHTHVVVFNVTGRHDGAIRALEPRELYKTQQYGTAVYRSELSTRLIALGYRIERGQSEQPEIRGYSAAYLEASSPRCRQIQANLKQAHWRGARAAEIVGYRTREAKGEVSHEEMQRRHGALASAHGKQAARVVEAARARVLRGECQVPQSTACGAVTYAKDRNLRRGAVADERWLMRDALRRSMGDVTLKAIKNEFAHRVAAGEFVSVERRPGAPGRAFTTRETPRETIGHEVGRTPASPTRPASPTHQVKSPEVRSLSVDMGIGL